MARGQAQAANTQLGITNTAAGQQGAEAQQLENELIPGYTSLANTGYMSPEEEAATTTNVMGSAAQPFESAGFEAANKAGATNNAADLTASEDQLALEKGQTMGGAAAGLEQNKLQNEEAGMYGLNQLEQGNLGAMQGLYGLGPGTLQARAAGQSGDQIAQGWGSLGLSAIAGH